MMEPCDRAAMARVIGECRSQLEVLPDGRYRLHEKWRWTSGDSSSGESVVEELPSSSSATPSA